MEELVTRPDDLDALITRLRGEARVAVDTEFVWERTYYPRLGLVQLGTEAGDTYLLDPLALDLAPLGALLADASVEKVLHDAGQDLAILHRATGTTAVNVFDTRLAAGFAGLPSTLSLGRLIAETTGVRLAKTESRSDWVRRPLTPAQVDYAHDDVRHLARAAHVLEDRIEAAGRLPWLREELAALDEEARSLERAPDDAYLRLKGQGRLHPKERAILRRLAAWREAEAQRADVPRGHVVPDDALVTVAQRKPATEEAVLRIGTVGKRHARAVADAVAAGLNDPPIRLPEAPAEDETLGARVDLMLAFVKGRGLSDGVDPALVAARADIVALAADGADADPSAHRLLRGWRGAFVGDDLIQLLRGTLSLRLDPKSGVPTAA
jgi:ribonuclease D